MLTPYPEQLAQIKRTARGYVHKLEPNSHEREHNRSVCQLNLVQKRKAALYLIELCKITNKLKINYEKMVSAGLLTSKDGLTMSLRTFKLFSMNKLKFAQTTKMEERCNKLIGIIEESGGQIEASYSHIWELISSETNSDTSSTRSAAARTGRILKELINQDLIIVDRIDVNKSVFKLKGDK